MKPPSNFTVPSPFCAAKGGRVERSEAQGVHTVAEEEASGLNPLQFPLEQQVGGSLQSSPLPRWERARACPGLDPGVRVNHTP